MAEDKSKSKRRRMLKQAPTSTVRELGDASKKPKKPSKASKLKKAGSPVAKLLKPVGRVLRPIGVIFRPIKFIGRFIIPPYFKNSWKELRQVTWPNGKQTRQLTLAVIIFSIVFGAIVAVFDYGLDKLFKEVIIK